MDSEQIKQMCVRVEKVFKSTVAALNNAATVNHEIYKNKTTDY